MNKKFLYQSFLWAILAINSITLHAQTTYHAAINGTLEGDGSIENPWPLYEALTEDIGTIGPGDSLLVHEGTYVGRFVSWLEGTADKPIVITNYRNDKVVIDGVIDTIGPENGQAIVIGGEHIVFEGFTVTNSNPTRSTDVPGSKPPGQGIGGLFIMGDYIIARNNIFRDNHNNGVSIFGNPKNPQVYGNLFLYNGWDGPDRGSAYGLYIQNEDTANVIDVHDNIIYANFSKGTHVYGEQVESLRNVKLNHNISFEAGFPSKDGATENCLFVGGLAPLSGIEMNYNHTYLSRDDRGACIRSGYWQQDNTDIEIIGNYMVGGLSPLQISYCEEVDVKDNFVYHRGHIYGSCVRFEMEGYDTTTLNFESNSYFYTGERSDHMGGKNWDEWQADGKDVDGTIYFSAPQTNSSHLRHYPGVDWASLVIYDWEELNTVAVDLSSYVPIGKDYLIYDVQNIDGPPVAQGLYEGGSVEVPTKLTDVTPVYGNDVPNPIQHTSQEFNAYLVKFQEHDGSLSTAQKQGNLNLTCFPNPTRGEVQIRLKSESSDVLSLKVVDISGRLVYEKDIFVNAGSNTFSFDISAGKGVYFISLRNNNQNEVVKVVKQ